jgi:hypothetical protein
MSPDAAFDTNCVRKGESFDKEQRDGTPGVPQILHCREFSGIKKNLFDPNTFVYTPIEMTHSWRCRGPLR